jgi:hypothetical protein
METALTRNPATTLAREELEAMDTGQLKIELAKALSLTVEGVCRAGTILSVLRERGEEAPALRYAHHLVAVGDGRLLPEAVVSFAGRPSLLARLTEMPISAQRRLVDARVVAVVTPGGEVRDVPLAELSPAEQTLALSPEGHRNPDEQRAIIERRGNARRKPVRENLIRTGITFDPTAGIISIGRKRAPVSAVLAAIAAAAAPETEADADLKTVMFRICESDHRLLKIRAAEGDSTIEQIVRGALIVAGLIPRAKVAVTGR